MRKLPFTIENFGFEIEVELKEKRLMKEYNNAWQHCVCLTCVDQGSNYSIQEYCISEKLQATINKLKGLAKLWVEAYMDKGTDPNAEDILLTKLGFES